MADFTKLLKEKNKRLNDIPAEFLTVVEKQQKVILNDIINQLSSLTTVDGKIKINGSNLKEVVKISDELKSIFLNDEYLKAVKEFTGEFVTQANLNDKLIKAGFGEIAESPAAKIYIDIAKKNAINALTTNGIELNYISPLQSILEASVVNGASLSETIASIKLFVDGGEGEVSKILKYASTIANESFVIADRSYTSIIADYLDSEWFYYSGDEIQGTRCFCKERVGHYFHYLEIESWGNGANLGDCDLGGGEWAGMIEGTNSATIFSYLGGWRCRHSLMPASEFGIPEEDMQRAINLGFVK
jgi:hypothetical protein